VRDEQVGAAIRAVRQRRGWRQRDVAAAAGVSQGVVSFVERGQLERVSLAALRSVGAALDVALPVTPRWRGGELDRLLDAAHARLVEHVTSTLAASRWVVVVEYSFNHFGDRGSVDVLAWRARGEALLLVEVKSRLVDLQALMLSGGRKLRVVPDLLARERGWRARCVGTVVAMPGTRFNRDAVERHAATFGAAYPARSRDVRAWLREPEGPMRGLWFVAPTTDTRCTRDRRGTVRVRRRRAPT
jgi:transcriptional regulator with XRE-family HTH domain